MFITNKLPETLAEETPEAWSLSQNNKQKTKQTLNWAVISKNQWHVTNTN